MTKLASEPGVVPSVPPSEESETEWNEDIEEAGTWPEPFPPRDGIDIPSFEAGVYALSTVRESDFLRGPGGRGGYEGPVCDSEELEEFDTETDLSEL